jgi:hypothetical protein
MHVLRVVVWMAVALGVVSAVACGPTPPATHRKFPHNVDAGTVDEDAGPGGEGEGEGEQGPVVRVPLGGCSFEGYSANFTIGRTQTFRMSLDTGSTTTAVASSLCPTCTTETPRYTPGPGATTSHEATAEEYGDGSSWQGDIYVDSAQMGTIVPAVPMAFAAMTSESDFFDTFSCNSQNATSTSAIQGILGIGPDENLLDHTDSYLTKVLAQSGLDNTFAFQLCPRGGNMWVGGFDPAFATAAPQFTPLLPISFDNPFYTVQFTDVGFAGTSLGFGVADYGDVTVDTGTSQIVLPDQIFRALASAIEANSAFRSAFPGAGAVLFDQQECRGTNLSRAQLDAALPPLTVTLPRVGGGTFTLSLPATSSYLFPIKNDQQPDLYCAGIGPLGDNSPSTTLGDTGLLGLISIFDAKNERMGFAPQVGCP